MFLRPENYWQLVQDLVCAAGGCLSWMLCCTLHALLNDGEGLSPWRRRTEGCHGLLYSNWCLTGVTAVLLLTIGISCRWQSINL